MKKLWLLGAAGAVPLCLLFLFVGCAQRPCAHETMIKTVVAATCEEEGYVRHQCEDCLRCFSSEPTAPLGHELTAETVAATCDRSGYILFRCARCDRSFSSDFTEPTGHAFEATTVPPTCDGQGYTEERCTVCGWSYRGEFTAPVGHRFTTTLTYPTRPTAGRVTRACDCGYSSTNALLYSDVFAGAAVENTAVLARGVDVSVWQHKQNERGEYSPLDWNAIRQAGFDFAILKAGSTPRVGEAGGVTVSKGGMDPVFEQNYRGAKAAGLEVGVYFYTYATTVEQVTADARLLLTWLEGKQLEYPVYFDLEDPSLSALSKETLTEFAVVFLTILQENGYYGALYSNQDWLANRLNQEPLKAAFDVWYARYPSTQIATPAACFTWKPSVYGAQLGLWQYTCRGVIDGIDETEFDFNYAYRDYPSIIKRFGYNGYEPIL